MPKFTKLKKVLRDSPFPGEVQKSILQEARDMLRKDNLTEDQAATAAVKKFHDIVDEDMRAARAALRG